MTRRRQAVRGMAAAAWNKALGRESAEARHSERGRREQWRGRSTMGMQASTSREELGRKAEQCPRGGWHRTTRAFLCISVRRA